MTNPLDAFEADPKQSAGLKVHQHQTYLRVIHATFGTRFYPVVEGTAVVNKDTRSFTQTSAVKRAETLTLAARAARDKALKAKQEQAEAANEPR